jgi:hypothetical protein
VEVSGESTLESLETLNHSSMHKFRKFDFVVGQTLSEIEVQTLFVLLLNLF